MGEQQGNSGPVCAFGEHPFSYHLIMSCSIAGKEYEFSKEFRSPTQHGVGDVMHIGELEGVRIAVVEWYIDEPGHAFMETDDMELDGAPQDWINLLEHFDGSTPELLG